MPWANDGGGVWNAARCTPAQDDPNALGEACAVEGSGVSGIDSCALGQMCWDVNPKDNSGYCASLCQGIEANPVCPGDSQCMEMFGTFWLCVDGCDPLLQDCGAGQACAPTLGPLVCAPDGTAVAGDACDTDGCVAGTVCVDSVFVAGCTDLACCSPYCDPSGAPCPMGADCQPLDDNPALGVCVAP